MFLKQSVVLFSFCPYQAARPSLTDCDIKQRKKRKMDELRKITIKKKECPLKNRGNVVSGISLKTM